uniref:Carboxypeptidase regulatory-like domain-containing protein n=1 Tax=Solibacter usitatus (strain Ellin6076) TaxID=234267 RepID=Q024W8_SOLUE
MNAKQKTTNRSNMARTLTIAAAAVLALGLGPLAKAADKGCTNATISGTFSQRGTGVITAPASLAGPMANAGTLTFDGNGGVTGVVVNSLNGTIVTGTEKGTYHVNADCTGTYTVQISPLGITGNAYFVINDLANEIQILTTDPDVVIVCVARRQFPVGDWRQ